MATLIDAEALGGLPGGVRQEIAADAAGIASYVDGDDAQYANAVQEFPTAPHLPITVEAGVWLALPVLMFDVETGNAGAPEAARACRARSTAGLVSVIYANHSTIPSVSGALASQGLSWTDAVHWPDPTAGIYLMDADPGVDVAVSYPHLNTRANGMPVDSVATQWLWGTGFDQSVTYGPFPAVGAGATTVTASPPTIPVPAPALPEESSMSAHFLFREYSAKEPSTVLPEVFEKDGIYVRAIQNPQTLTDVAWAMDNLEVNPNQLTAGRTHHSDQVLCAPGYRNRIGVLVGTDPLKGVQ